MTIVDAITTQESDAQTPVLGTRKRRTYSQQFKAEVVAQCLRPGASVSAIAMSHGINANVIRKWLPSARTPAIAHSRPAPVLLPVTIEAGAAAPSPAPLRPAIELDIHGASLRLPPGFDAQDLRSIVQVLRALS